MRVGQVTAPHGHRGEVRVYPLCDRPERLAQLREVSLHWPREGRRQPARVESARPHRGMAVVKLQGVDDMNGAEALRGAYLEVAREEVPPLPPGRYYVFQIVGLAVYTTDGQHLGTVVDVLDLPANDVYVVRPEGRGARDLLVPALRQVVREIDVAGGRMVIEPLPGLLDPEPVS